MAQSEISKVTKKTVENHDEEEEFGPQLITKLQVYLIKCVFNYQISIVYFRKIFIRCIQLSR